MTSHERPSGRTARRTLLRSCTSTMRLRISCRRRQEGDGAVQGRPNKRVVEPSTFRRKSTFQARVEVELLGTFFGRRQERGNPFHVVGGDFHRQRRDPGTRPTLGRAQELQRWADLLEALLGPEAPRVGQPCCGLGPPPRDGCALGTRESWAGFLLLPELDSDVPLGGSLRSGSPARHNVLMCNNRTRTPCTLGSPPSSGSRWQLL